jgi:hypothetical protein
MKKSKQNLKSALKYVNWNPLKFKIHVN